MPRPYKTPGGIITSSIALVLQSLLWSQVLLLIRKLLPSMSYLLLTFVLQLSHLVKGTPEEEFANIKAEQEL